MTFKSALLMAGSVLVSSILASRATAQPLDFSEVSLLVRARETQTSIVQQVQQRKLVHALTPEQESTLRAQGARDALIQALRAPGAVLSADAAAAYETRKGDAANAPRGESRRGGRAPMGSAGVADNDDLHVFEVSVGHPVNLSQWGGPDYDFAFRAPSRLDDGREDAVMIDNVRSFTHTATYLGEGRADDSTTVFDRRNFVSVMDHSFTRGLRIDRNNPVSMKGVPYTLYPVYAAGGVSLYYIGATSSSVKLAVQTAGR